MHMGMARSEEMIGITKDDAYNIVDTISKAREIVFCKDCKYWEVDNDVGFCARTEDCDWNANDFCSKGERTE